MSVKIVDGREPKGTISDEDKNRSRGTYVREHKAELRQVIQKLFYEKKNSWVWEVCSFAYLFLPEH